MISHPGVKGKAKKIKREEHFMFEKLKSAHENLADEMEKEHKEFVQSCKDSICEFAQNVQ